MKIRVSGGDATYERIQPHVIPREMVRIVLPRQLLAARGFAAAPGLRVDITSEVTAND